MLSRTRLLYRANPASQPENFTTRLNLMNNCLRPITTGLNIAAMLLLLGPLMGCKSSNPSARIDPASAAAQKHIFVTDFELAPQDIQSDPGILSGRSGPAGRIGNRLYGTSSDPEARAREVVDLMSKSLVKDLSKAGLSCSRLAPGTPLPTEGWLVRGSFTKVNEGNRLQRSMIGMGQGQTDVQVLSCVNDLSKGPPKPLQEISAEANSGNKIGGAPTLALTPYGAAVHFVRAGTDLEKNVTETASHISAQIVQYIEQQPKQ